MRGGRLTGVVVVGLLMVLSGSAIALTTALDPATNSSPTVPLITDELALPHGVGTRTLAPSTELSITLTLPFSQPSELSRFLVAVEDPNSPSYRHFLSVSQFLAEFGPSASNIQAVTSVLLSHGAAHVTVAPGGTEVSAVLPAGAVQQLFGVRFVTYGVDGGLPLYTGVGAPTLPAALAGRVVGVGGLSDEADPFLSLELRHGAVSAVQRSSSSEFVQ